MDINKLTEKAREGVVTAQSLAAEHCRRDRHWHLDVEVPALALEHRVRSQPHAQVEIARGTAADTGLALAGNAHARSVADAGRDPHVHGSRVTIVLEREPPRGAVVGVVE